MEESEPFDESNEKNIEMLRDQIRLLNSQISEAYSLSDSQPDLSSLLKQIEDTETAIKEKSSLLIKQEAEKDWISHNNPKASEILLLKSRENQIITDLSVHERKIQNDSKNLDFSYIKNTNPKLYSLIQKYLKSAQLNNTLKKSFSLAAKEKNKIRCSYAKICAALSQEDVTKKKIRDLELRITEKESKIKELLESINKASILVDSAKKNYEESNKRLILDKCREEQELKESLDNLLAAKKTEYEEVVKDLEEAEKYPEKIVQNSMSTSEILKENKQLEVMITQRNKEAKEMEREKKKLLTEIEKKSKESAALKKIEAPNKAGSKELCLEPNRANPTSKSLVSTKSEKFLNKDKGLTGQPRKKEASLDCTDPIQKKKIINSIATKLIEQNRSQFALSKTLFNKNSN